jgi:hypothetical protein
MAGSKSMELFIKGHACSSNTQIWNQLAGSESIEQFIYKRA